jgi:hypothetical protein
VEGHEDACRHRGRRLHPDCHHCGAHRQGVSDKRTLFL